MSCAERGVVDRCDERGGARQLAHQGPLERLALTCDALPRAQGAPIAPIRPQATSPAQARPGGGAVWGAPPPQRHPQPAVLSRSPEPTHTTAPAGAIPAPIQGTCHFYDLVWSPRPAAACLWAASGSSASQASRSELTRLGIFSLTCGDLSSSARGGARCALAVRGCGRGRRLWRGGGSTRASRDEGRKLGPHIFNLPFNQRGASCESGDSTRVLASRARCHLDREKVSADRSSAVLATVDDLDVPSHHLKGSCWSCKRAIVERHRADTTADTTS